MYHLYTFYFAYRDYQSGLDMQRMTMNDPVSDTITVFLEKIENACG